MIKKEQVKKWTDKKKTDLFVVFCKCVSIPWKQVQDRSKEFLGNKNNINKKKKRFLGKATSHNDHYIINMSSQRPKIGSNWPLASPNLQRYIIYNYFSHVLLRITITNTHHLLFKQEWFLSKKMQKLAGGKSIKVSVFNMMGIIRKLTG